MSPQESILALKKALNSLTFIISELDAAIDEAGFFSPEAATSAAEAQIETLLKIQNEIGPRLIERIRNGELSKYEDLKKLIENATNSSVEIGKMLTSEVSIPAAVQFVTSNTIQDLKETAKEAAKATAPIGLIVGAALLLYLLKK